MCVAMEMTKVEMRMADITSSKTCPNIAGHVVLVLTIVVNATIREMATKMMLLLQRIWVVAHVFVIPKNEICFERVLIKGSRNYSIMYLVDVLKS